jgi:tRNA A-37 threonylcarbamoyl transferase component Bud32
LIEVDGLKLVVKKFKVPHLINRIAYGFFRKSKARRSYEYSKMLLEKGFGAAVPVAYREDKNLGLLSTSYYISLYCDYGRDFNEFRWVETGGREAILRDFARFTARLHDAGIQHLDYGGGNILFRQTDDKAQFCLIDINRMRLGKVDMKQGCENFRLLYLTEEPFRILTEEYALARGFDFESCFELIKPYIHPKR